MMRILDFNQLSPEEILTRTPQAEADVEAAVDEILSQVRLRGDAALRDYTKRFDGADLASLEVTEAELTAARSQLARLQEQVSQLEPMARRYHQLKDRVATVELDAHRKAQATVEEGEAQARQVMEQAQSQAQAVLEEGHHQARQLQAQTRQWLEQVMGDYQVLRQGLGELFGSVRTLTVLAQRVEEMDKQMQSLQEKVMGHEQR